MWTQVLLSAGWAKEALGRMDLARVERTRTQRSNSCLYSNYGSFGTKRNLQRAASLLAIATSLARKSGPQTLIATFTTTLKIATLPAARTFSIAEAKNYFLPQKFRKKSLDIKLKSFFWLQILVIIFLQLATLGSSLDNYSSTYAKRKERPLVKANNFQERGLWSTYAEEIEGRTELNWLPWIQTPWLWTSPGCREGWVWETKKGFLVWTSFSSQKLLFKTKKNIFEKELNLFF